MGQINNVEIGKIYNVVGGGLCDGEFDDLLVVSDEQCFLYNIRISKKVSSMIKSNDDICTIKILGVTKGYVQIEIVKEDNLNASRFNNQSN